MQATISDRGNTWGNTSTSKFFLVEAVGRLYGPFDDASAAASWFARARPNFMAPWKIIPIEPPDEPPADRPEPPANPP